MEIINFEDGQLVSPAKVTIDNVQHEVTPAQYSGSTPLSAFVLNKMQKNLIAQRYIKKITANSMEGGQITLPCNYKVGQNTLDVYLKGEKLLLSSDNAGTDGHYREVGEENSISNKVKLTTDWNLEVGDILELVVRGDYGDTE